MRIKSQEARAKNQEKNRKLFIYNNVLKYLVKYFFLADLYIFQAILLVLGS